MHTHDSTTSSQQWYALTATMVGILDVTSGYNGMLDSRLDALLLANQDENSVGRVIIGRFLELLGSTYDTADAHCQNVQ